MSWLRLRLSIHRNIATIIFMTERRDMYAGEQLSTVFRASAGNGKAESLGEVTLSSMSANNSYTVQVYTNLKDASDPTSGTPAYSTPVSCSQPMAGVMTFQIPEVLLSQNSLYSIVVTNAGSTYIKYCVVQLFSVYRIRSELSAI